MQAPCRCWGAVGVSDEQNQAPACWRECPAGVSRLQTKGPTARVNPEFEGWQEKDGTCQSSGYFSGLILNIHVTCDRGGLWKLPQGSSLFRNVPSEISSIYSLKSLLSLQLKPIPCRLVLLEHQNHAHCGLKNVSTCMACQTSTCPQIWALCHLPLTSW